MMLSGIVSEWGSVTRVVPQGSVLGPLFSIILHNLLSDVVEHRILCTVNLYTYNTAIMPLMSSPVQYTVVLSWNRTYSRSRTEFHPMDCG